MSGVTVADDVHHYSEVVHRLGALFLYWFLPVYSLPIAKDITRNPRVIDGAAVVLLPGVFNGDGRDARFA